MRGTPTPVTNDSVLEASLNELSFRTGEPLILTLAFNNPAACASVTNISVDFFRVETERNQFAWGFGAAPNKTGRHLEIAERWPNGLPLGLHFTASAMISRQDEPDEVFNSLRCFVTRGARWSCPLHKRR